jgi:hypothetical protein
MYKSHSFSCCLPGVSCKSRQRSWQVYLGQQISGVFPGHSHYSDWPVFRTVEIYDKLQIKLTIIHSSLLA